MKKLIVGKQSSSNIIPTIFMSKTNQLLLLVLTASLNFHLESFLKTVPLKRKIFNNFFYLIVFYNILILSFGGASEAII